MLSRSAAFATLHGFSFHHLAALSFVNIAGSMARPVSDYAEQNFCLVAVNLTCNLQGDCELAEWMRATPSTT